MQPTSSPTIESESLRLLLQAGRWIWTIHIPAVSVALVFLWEEPFRNLLIGWFVAYCAMVFLQRWYCVRSLQRLIDPSQASAIFWPFTTSSVVIGALWGVLGFVFFPTHVELQYLVTLLIGGAALAAVATLHFSALTLSLTLITALPWLGLRHVMEDAPQSILVGILVWLFMGLLIQFGIQLHRSSTRAIRLQLEHGNLLHVLQARSEALDLARKEAIAANEAKSRFLAHASHDLRQPLHAAGLFLESLDLEDLGTDRNSAIIQRVRSSLGGLSKLFDTLLDVSLLDTGQIEIQRQTIALSGVFEQLESEFTPVAKENDVQLRFMRTDIVLNTDAFILRRILQNLLSNAIRNSAGGRVLLGCRRHKENVEVQVLDNGLGITDSDQSRIFEEFTRLATDKSGNAKSGLGLGLAIVARLASKLHLQVDVRSAIGRGSVFAVKGFAYSELGPEVSVVPVNPMKITDDLSGKRIWVFDNDPETLDATVALLEKWQCEVHRSDDDHFPLSEKPQLIICDYEFSENSNGLDMIDRCRAHFQCSLPSIIISGNSSPELISAAREQQIPLLTKPVLAVRLRAALLHIFGVEQTGTDSDPSSGSASAYA